MLKDSIFSVLKQQIQTILPELNEQAITRNDSLKALGANSIDRAEIIMLTIAQLQLKISLQEFAKAQNIGELVDILHQYAAEQSLTANL